MSMVQQIVREVTALQRQVQDQLRLIDDFNRTNKDNILLVRSELSGSTKGHDARMIQAFSRAEASLDKSRAALQQAETALRRVAAI